MKIEYKFFFTVSAFVVSAISPVLVPFAIGADGNLNTMGFAAGVLFWAGILLGSICYFLLFQKEKKNIKEALPEKKLFSGFRFFSNPLAIIADVMLIVGVIGTIYCANNIQISEIVAVFFLVIMLVGIYTHFLFNGKLYRYIRECLHT